VIGGVSGGPYVLARAGLLEGYEFTLHWEYQPAFAEVFPYLKFDQRLNVVDRDRWTSSGGIACMDLALRIVQEEHGRALSNAVANQFQLERVRGSSALQRPFELEDYATLPPRLQDSIRLMDANIENPLPIPQIAEQVGTTVRSLERLFNKFLDCGPAAFYRRMRLERARHLLWHTNLSILEISFMTGFSSPSYLSRMYHVQYGKIPSQERR
jgi:transcriptional regulator GlxA family with amidase domain